MPRFPTSIFTLLSIAVWCGCSRAPETRPPNIVLIVADDLGWTDLGVYGSGYYETPNVDRLAREGMRFSNAYANPNCSPTRAALLTGRYSPRTGIYTVGSGARGHEQFRKMIPAENVTDLALDEITFAELAKEVGYTTAHMGKWHMGKGEYLPVRQGFDLNAGGNDSGSPRGGYFAPYKNPQLPDGPEGEHLTGRLAEEAVAFITKNKDAPFLLYLPFYAVHTPIQGRPDLIEKYEAKQPVGEHRHPTYAAMVDAMDQAVGRVLATLDELGIADETAVLFYSDNGGLGGYAAAGVDANIEVTSNAPLRGGKGMLYEGGIRVPLIVRWPGVVTAGSVSDALVGSIDLRPTLAEMIGADKIGTGLPEREIDGASFLPVLQGQSGAARGPLYWHFPGYLEGRRNIGAWRTTPGGAIRDGRYKLIEFFETGSIELYDLEADIGEQNDLAEAEPETAERLHGQLQDWRERLKAPMPIPK